MFVPKSYQTQEMPDPWPRIAIVTPTYNQANFLAATIESVLSQNCVNLFYKVQDAASTDGTHRLLESYGKDLHWQSRADDGQAQAINLGFSGVDCEIMAYLNSDDILLPGALAYVAKFFATHPEADVIYSHRINIDRDGLEIGRAILPRHDRETIKWSDYIPQETMFWRRGVWDALRGFDESFQFTMDWDYILRAQGEGFKFARVPRFLGCFRIHDAQKTATIPAVKDEETKRLWLAHLGRIPTLDEVRDATRPYLIRQLVYQYAYRSGLRRY